MVGSPRGLAQPVWLGKEDISGKRVLLHGEQGWGDMIMFSRYARFVAERGAEVLLELPNPLIPLMESLLGPTRDFGRGVTLPDFDYHCPLLSLPLAFGTTVQTIPGQVP